MKKHAPATLRNREPIAEILAAELPSTGIVLEIASGTGEHAVYFAALFSDVEWQPSDPDPEAVASIAAYRSDFEGSNLLKPILLDASADDWGADAADAALCVNMVHISPWEAAAGLFSGAASLLRHRGAPLILYGPFFEDGLEPAPSNLDFDRSLKSRDQRWGIRRIGDVDALADRHGFTRTARHEMPANNLSLVYRKT